MTTNLTSSVGSPQPGIVICDRYLLVEQLKHYKEVFICKDVKNDAQLVVKLEAINPNEINRLETEWKFYQKLSSTKCFDFVVDYLIDNSFRYLVMKPLGTNLYEFWREKQKCNDWTIERVARLADEMISRVANCHLRGVLHRDIKPENFVVDINNEWCLYLIDFNLAKQFSSAIQTHIPYRIKALQCSVGNVQFLSVNAHNGVEQSRRDDLISVCYSLIYLAKGSLPWSRIRSKSFHSRLEYLRAVGKLKSDCSLEELCDGLPVQFKRCLEYCLSLGFEEKPNYFELRKLFAELLQQIKLSQVVIVRNSHQNSKTVDQSSAKCRQTLSQNLRDRISSSPPSICP